MDGRGKMDSYRELFPVTKEYIYLNHAANSPEPLPVVRAVNQYLSACSCQGTVMADWKHKPTEVRENFARLINCNPANIAFLSNVSAAVNLVAGGLSWKPGDNVVVTRDQFPANVYPWMFLQNSGVEVRFADWQTCGFADSIGRLVDSRTRVVALSWVEYYTGHRQNLADVGILCEEMDIIFVVDAIQGLGVLPLSQPHTGADLIATGGHKWLLGPEGQGAAFISSKLLDRLNPRTYSWRSISDYMNFADYRLDLKPSADRFEAGTPNWPGVMGLGAALELILKVGPGKIAARIKILTQQLIAALEPLTGEILTPRAWTERAGIVSFKPRGMSAETIQERLLERKIVVSARRGAVRVSPHFYNTTAEIDALIATLRSILT